MKYALYRDKKSGAMLMIARLHESSQTTLRALVEHADEMQIVLERHVEVVVGGQHDWDNAKAFDLCPRFDFKGEMIPAD